MSTMESKSGKGGAAAEGKSGRLDIQGLKDSVRFELPEGGPDDRDEYIDYALDMVVHNLISSGQLDPSKAYLLKTADMRAHIGRMCDKVAKAKNKIDGSRIGSNIQNRNNHTAGTRYALQPNSLPITIITDKQPGGARGGGGSQRRSKLTPTMALKPKGTKLVSLPVRTAVKFNKLPDQRSGETQGRYRKPKMPPSTTALGTAVLLSSIKDGTLPMTEVPNMNSVSKMTAGFRAGQVNPKPVRASAQAFRVKLDMRGFNNEEISLDLDERKLTITGIRPKREELNARKATETVEIPDGINVDSLKIARQADGILVIEETVLDTETIL